jgi:adenine-specific DNA-methyltransferase
MLESTLDYIDSQWGPPWLVPLLVWLILLLFACLAHAAQQDKAEASNHQGQGYRTQPIHQVQRQAQGTNERSVMAKSPQQIWHGDSIELCKKFKPDSVSCVITDPPFGVDNQSNQAKTADGKAYARKIANDESPEIAIATFKAVMDSLLPKTKADADMYVFTSYQVLSDWLVMTDEFLPKHGFRRKAIIVWEKDGPGMGDLECPWGMGSEFILFFQKGRRPKSTKRRNSVVHSPQLRPNELIHPHEKPVELLELLIEASTNPGESLVDPFGGSGSLARAARRKGRPCVSIELDERNYNEAVKKLEGDSGGLF